MNIVGAITVSRTLKEVVMLSALTFHERKSLISGTPSNLEPVMIIILIILRIKDNKLLFFNYPNIDIL